MAVAVVLCFFVCSRTPMTAAIWQHCQRLCCLAGPTHPGHPSAIRSHRRAVLRGAGLWQRLQRQRQGMPGVSGAKRDRSLESRGRSAKCPRTSDTSKRQEEQPANRAAIGAPIGAPIARHTHLQTSASSSVPLPASTRRASSAPRSRSPSPSPERRTPKSRTAFSCRPLAARMRGAGVESPSPPPERAPPKPPLLPQWTSDVIKGVLDDLQDTHYDLSEASSSLLRELNCMDAPPPSLHLKALAIGKHAWKTYIAIDRLQHLHDMISKRESH